MKTVPPIVPASRCSALRRTADDRGAIIIVAIMFIMVFIIIGVALFWLITSQTRATEMERTDVKAFNVSEAGVDGGMLWLKMHWPRRSIDALTEARAVTFDAFLKSTLQNSGSNLWDPERSAATDFLRVSLYDNVDSAGHPTAVADMANRTITWDSNGDGKMFVDSTANVDDNRHRILIMAERQRWDLTFPTKLALWANQVDSNGQGLKIGIENGTSPVYYDVNDAIHKGLNIADPTNVIGQTHAPFSSALSDQMRAALQRVAVDNGTYFSGPNASSLAEAYLDSGNANCAVVYVHSDTAVTLSGNTQIGTEAEPVVLIIDTPDNVVNVWDYRGTEAFYGILITVGNSTLRGTTGIHGAIYCSGTLQNDGTGACGEINYNQKVIENINFQYIISVNIVPNTWEEYTRPREATTSTTAAPTTTTTSKH